MNIHDAKFDTCILCREVGKPGGKYYVRTDVKSSITELLQKIPAHLLHMFDYLPASSQSSSVSTPFCCRACKKLIEKRQKIVENLLMVVKEIVERGRLKRKQSCIKSINFSTCINENESQDQVKCDEITASPVSMPPAKRFRCDLSPIAVPQLPESCNSSSQPSKSTDANQHQSDLINACKAKVRLQNILTILC